VEKPEGKRPLRKHRCIWEDNIKIDLKEIGSGSIDWIPLAQNKDYWRVLLNTVIHLRVPYNIGNFFSD
jgi:hypothetical protein